jgi:DMSO/TMAO reductase YedYZ molybdopterin-dependent catalytic subunit
VVLADRNHGLPLEALRYDITPPGLHYVLTHYDIPPGDAHEWRLTVGGAVGEPLSLDVPSLRSFPTVTHRVTMECAGNGRGFLDPRPVSRPWHEGGVGTADWTGVPLHILLSVAGVRPGAAEVVFTGADHGVERGVEQDYQRSLPLAAAMASDPDVLVAYAMNGSALPPQHGYPLRLVVPGWYGMASVKWLRSIEVTKTAFTGYQQVSSYVWRASEDDPGTPLTRIEPRALMVPPGFPDYMSRTRVVRAGPVFLTGRAWSGHAPVASVAISSDAGHTWHDADLDPPGRHHWAWRSWRTVWTAAPGSHTLCVRVTDTHGNTQPLHPRWNVGGYANNAVQRVPVVCLDE